MAPKGYTIDIEKKKCVTPVCRGSYVNILAPRPKPDQPDKLAWGLQCLFPKTDPAVIAWKADLSKIYAKVLVDKFGQEKAAKMAARMRLPIRDGDDPKEEEKALQGFWFMNANNNFRQPYVIGVTGKPVDPKILTPDDIYSGAWYRVMLEFWHYNTAGNEGISCSVAAVMKVRDDESLGGGTTQSEASNAFGDYTSEIASAFSDGGSAGETSAKGKGADAGDNKAGFEFM